MYPQTIRMRFQLDFPDLTLHGLDDATCDKKTSIISRTIPDFQATSNKSERNDGLREFRHRMGMTIASMRHIPPHPCESSRHIHPTITAYSLDACVVGHEDGFIIRVPVGILPKKRSLGPEAGRKQ